MPCLHDNKGVSFVSARRLLALSVFWYRWFPTKVHMRRTTAKQAGSTYLIHTLILRRPLQLRLVTDTYLCNLGGRTAWQSWVSVSGDKYNSRFSYAGHHNAQEDAAEVALKCILSRSPPTQMLSPTVPTTYPGFSRPYHNMAPSSSPPSSANYTLGTASGNVSSQTSAAVSVPHRQQPPIQHQQYSGFNALN